MILAFKGAEYAADERFTWWWLPLIAFVFLLVYHRIALPASTYSRAKGVCLFSFIVPELDPATYAWRHLLTKLGASSPLGRGLELRQSQGRRISRDVIVRWDTRGKKANDRARRRAARSQKDDAPTGN
jgi:hypothetical protein